MSVEASPSRSHVHAIVGLAERVVVESSDPLAQELAVAIGHQARSLLGELAWAAIGSDGQAVGVADSGTDPDAADAVDPASVVDSTVLSTLADEIGSPDIVATLVDTFLGELDERIVAIQDGAVDRGEEACRAAHTLKGTAATMGATELTSIAAELEHQFRSGEGEPDPLVRRLPDAGQRCRDALRQVLESMEVNA